MHPAPLTGQNHCRMYVRGKYSTLMRSSCLETMKPAWEYEQMDVIVMRCLGPTYGTSVESENLLEPVYVRLRTNSDAYRCMKTVRGKYGVYVWAGVRRVA